HADDIQLYGIPVHELLTHSLLPSEFIGHPLCDNDGLAAIRLRVLNKITAFNERQPHCCKIVVAHFDNVCLKLLCAHLQCATIPVRKYSACRSGHRDDIRILTERIAVGVKFRLSVHPRNDSTLHIKAQVVVLLDRKSTRLNSSHVKISYAAF